MDKEGIKRNISGEIELPASKSISNRLLVMNALSGNKITINNLSQANDTKILSGIFTGIIPNSIDCHDAGTVLRFLTAYCAITPGKWLLTGTVRLQERPVKILAEKLKELGADIIYTGNEGYPPLLITGKKLNGGKITVDASVSSQYISALMMVAPYLSGGLEIVLEGKKASWPYILMTAGLMEKCGIIPEINKNTILIHEGKYLPAEITVEGDWSAASYWYAMMAVAGGGSLLLKGLDEDSLQGDSLLTEWMKPFGVDTRFTDEGAVISKIKNDFAFFEGDFSNQPDLALTFIALCGAMGKPARFYGLESLAIKESDRTAAIATELEKLNIEFIRQDNYWELTPNPELKSINFIPDSAVFLFAKWVFFCLYGF